MQRRGVSATIPCLGWETSLAAGNRRETAWETYRLAKVWNRVCIVGVGLIGGSVGLAGAPGAWPKPWSAPVPGRPRSTRRSSWAPLPTPWPTRPARWPTPSWWSSAPGRPYRGAGRASGPLLPARHLDYRRRQHQGADRRRNGRSRPGEKLATRRPFRGQPSAGRQRKARSTSCHGRAVRRSHGGGYPHHDH